MDKVIIYTVITGGYDSLPEITPEPSVEYWLFTDDASIPTQQFWNRFALSNPSGLNPRRLSRLPKLRPHIYLPAHEISIYIDANTVLIQPVSEFAKYCVQEMPFAVHRHPGRRCVYSEAEKCLSTHLDDPKIIVAQMERYKRNGFPADFGLTENRFIVRRNVEAVTMLDECWHREYFNGSQRDQLSFMYCVWQTGVPIFTIPQSSRQNPYYKIQKHLPLSRSNHDH